VEGHLNSKTVIFRRAELYSYFAFYLVNICNKIAKFDEIIFNWKLAAVMALFTSVFERLRESSFFRWRRPLMPLFTFCLKNDKKHQKNSAKIIQIKMGKNSVQKVSSGWKKRVKIEYARLRHQKKFRHQDDIRVAWRGNRVAMQASHIKVRFCQKVLICFCHNSKHNSKQTNIFFL
jgi:hypothetical protein